jgi:hypothetical protein
MDKGKYKKLVSWDEQATSYCHTNSKQNLCEFSYNYWTTTNIRVGVNSCESSVI